MIGSYLPRLRPAPPDGEAVSSELGVDGLPVLQGLGNVLNEEDRRPAEVADLGAPEEQTAATSSQPSAVTSPRQVLAREPESNDVGLNEVEREVVDVLELGCSRPVLGQDLPGWAVVVAYCCQVQIQVGQGPGKRQFQPPHIPNIVTEFS